MRVRWGNRLDLVTYSEDNVSLRRILMCNGKLWSDSLTPGMFQSSNTAALHNHLGEIPQAQFLVQPLEHDHTDHVPRILYRLHGVPVSVVFSSTGPIPKPPDTPIPFVAGVLAYDVLGNAGMSFLTS